MSRSLRLEYPGALWHVTNRGVEKRFIFLNDADRTKFLELLATAIELYRWRLHTYVLMSNHFHLLIETVEPTLSRGMKMLTGDYASYFNWRHGRVGHLFQGRFKGHLVDSDTYFLEVARYIVLNPVRAGMVPEPGGWIWSSYRSTSGIDACPAWLTVTEILARFDSDRAAASRQYPDFVVSCIGDKSSPWDHLVGQLYLGSESFIERTQRRITERSPLSHEHPRSQRLPSYVDLEHVRQIALAPKGQPSAEFRLAFAVLARDEALATLPDIGRVLGIGGTGASYLVRTAKRRVHSDSQFGELVEDLRRKLRNCRLQT